MNKLKAIRTEKNVTQQELADKLGITRQAISMVETEQNDLTVDLAKKIGEILKVDWKDFF